MSQKLAPFFKIYRVFCFILFCTVPQCKMKSNVTFSIGDFHNYNNKIPNAAKHTWFQICLQFLLNLLISVTSVQKWASLRHSHYVLKCLRVQELVIVPWNLIAGFGIHFWCWTEKEIWTKMGTSPYVSWELGLVWKGILQNDKEMVRMSFRLHIPEDKKKKKILESSASISFLWTSHVFHRF